MSPLSALNLSLRVVMESGVVAGLAYWGIHTGDSTAGKIALGLAAPIVGFGIWGAVDFRRAGGGAEALRLVEELVISGLTATALIAAGRPGLGAALAAVSAVHHVLVYAIGERLLKPSTSHPSARSGMSAPRPIEEPASLNRSPAGGTRPC